MSDLYELQLSLELPTDLGNDDLNTLRWQLGTEDCDPPTDVDEADDYPLFSSRGPAARIGGTLIGDLEHGRRGWSLTVRQEVHPDEFPRLDSLLTWLSARTTTVGTVGYLRFLEDHAPDLFVTDAGSITRITLKQQQAEADLLPYE